MHIASRTLRHKIADHVEARIEFSKTHDQRQWWKSNHVAGFRLSPQDLWIVGTGLALAVAASVSDHPLATLVSWYLPFVVLHFFLFCNVFCVGSLCEVVWTVTFLGNFIGVSLWLMEVPQAWSLLYQLPVTAGVVGLSITLGHHSGILCRMDEAIPRFEEIVRNLRHG